MASPWLGWVQQLQAIAQTGQYYDNHPFDRERYQQIQTIATAMLTALADAEPATIADLLEADWGHATPKLDVRGAVFRDDTILLVRERMDGKWSLPGGWVDIGEPPSRAIEREIFEESGFQTRATKLLALYDRSHPRHGHNPAPHHAYKLFFRCDLIGGTATESYETTEVAFFPPDRLPPLSTGRVVESQILRLFEHLAHPDWPTDFD